MAERPDSTRLAQELEQALTRHGVLFEAIRAMPHVERFSVGFIKKPPSTPAAAVECALEDGNVHTWQWRAWVRGEEYGEAVEIRRGDRPATLLLRRLLLHGVMTLRKLGASGG